MPLSAAPPKGVPRPAVIGRCRPTEAARRRPKPGPGPPLLLKAAALVLAAGLLVPASQRDRPQLVGPRASAPRGPATAGLPISFEENRGQTDERVRYLARIGADIAYFRDDSVIFWLKAPQTKGAARPPLGVDGLRDHLTDEPAQGHLVVMQLEGANPEPEIVAADMGPGYSNYIRGSDPTGWTTHVPTYYRITYRSLYEGIDLTFYEGPSGGLEYDFRVAPGADPSKIALRFRGHEAIELGGSGELVVRAETRELTQSRPFIYQETPHGREEVAGGFVVSGARVGFELGDYDSSQALVIDPELIYSTYLGGIWTDDGFDIAVDMTGSAYVVGHTASPDFPLKDAFDSTTTATWTAFVTKMNPDGSGLIWSTYLGGTLGGRAMAVSVTSQGEAVVSGGTSAADFPTTPGAFRATPKYPDSDGFLTKFSADGASLVYSTYLGGVFGYGVDVDQEGSAYTVGSANITDYATPGAFQEACADCPSGGDAAIAKFDPAGTRVYASYLGGNRGDDAMAVAVDAQGCAYVTGAVFSYDFPTLNAFQPAVGGAPWVDSFITKFSPDGASLVYSSYLGGQGQERGYGVAVDAAGYAYVSGYTDSVDFPTVNAFQPARNGPVSDAFLTKVAPDGSALVYSTYLGGTNQEFQTGYVAVDGAGNAHVAGGTRSSDFPLVDPFQSVTAGYSRGFVAKFDASGGAIYSSYLGASSGTGVYAVDVDGPGNAYVTGATTALDFPTTPGAFQSACGGIPEDCWDAFLAKVGNPYPKRVDLSGASAQSQGPAQRPSLSSDGRYVAFHSPAGDLVPSDTNQVGDVFVKDTVSMTIERVSLGPGGTEAQGGSRFPSITPDARYVAYFSDATDLVPGDNNGHEDVFVYDRLSGNTERVSVSSLGAEGTGGDSRFPSITPDARYIAFQSKAEGLIPGDTNGAWDVFVRDRATGTTERISVSDAGTQIRTSARASISDDGRFVVFHSWANDAVTYDTNGKIDVFVRDRLASATTRVSVSTTSQEGDGDSSFARISGDGTAVVFHSDATNLVASDANGVRDTFVRDLGAQTTERISVSSGGTEADGQSGYGAISVDGRYVAFHGTASNLAATDTAGQQDVFVHDRTTSETLRVSISQGGLEGNGLAGSAAVSPEGGWIAYQAVATNLVTGDTNSARDVFYAPRPSG